MNIPDKFWIPIVLEICKKKVEPKMINECQNKWKERNAKTRWHKCQIMMSKNYFKMMSDFCQMEFKIWSFDWMDHGIDLIGKTGAQTVSGLKK